MTKEDQEQLFLNLGVDARWISVYHDVVGSYFKSDNIPTWKNSKPEEYDRQLKEWVEIIHSHKMSAMSWYALPVCARGWDENSDWRQHFLTESRKDAHDRKACCINSPYGDAVIAYVIGAAHCRKKFKIDTGLETPTKFDWNSSGFSTWVKWRFDMFAEYWQKLVDGVHKVIPEDTIAFNNYHREGSGWLSAIPFKSFGKDFVFGTEADGESLKGLYYTRLMKAFGSHYTEVWMGMRGRKATVKGKCNNPREMIDFAVSACTGGGYCSAGGDPDGNLIEALALKDMSYEIRQRAEYLNIPSVPYVALHV